MHSESWEPSVHRWDRAVQAGWYRCLAWSVLLYLTWLLVIPEPYETNRVLGSIQRIRVNGYLLHLIAYVGAGLPVLCLNGTRPAGSAWPLLSLLVFHAVLTEFVQRFVPTRTADVGDLAANAAGILIAYGIYVTLNRRIRAAGAGGLTRSEASRIMT